MAKDLHAALREDDEDTVQRLLDEGADVNQRDRYHMLPLMYATSNGNVENVNKLIKAGANVNEQCNNYSFNLVMWAVRDGKDECLEALVKAGANVNATETNSRSALHFAAENNHEKCVEVLLEAGADVNQVQNDWDYEHDQVIPGDTPLKLAVKKGSWRCFEKMMKYLIENECEIQEPEGYRGVTLLMEVALAGNPRCLELLLQLHLQCEDSVEINQRSEDGDTALVNAVRGGSMKCVELLLAACAAPSLSVPDYNSLLPIHVAVQLGSVEMIQVLMKAGADVNTSLGRAPPIFFAKNRETLDFLLDSGADLKATDECGRGILAYQLLTNAPEETIAMLIEAGVDVNHSFPLATAAAYGKPDHLRTLIAHGADVNITDTEGSTALFSALRYSECVQLLIQAGADVNVARHNGETVLMYAAEYGFIDAVELLIKAGADVKAVNPNGQPTLIKLIQSNPYRVPGAEVIFKKLVQAGADVNCTGGNGTTALMYTVSQGKSDMMQVLLESGANVNVVDSQGKTALIWASQTGMKCGIRTLKLLIKSGAHVNSSTSGRNALETYFAYGYRDPNVAKMLQAAGERMGSAIVAGMSVPEYLQFTDIKTRLDHMCREAIRKRLLNLSPMNLFLQIPKLALPTAMSEYLLYNVKLPES